MHTHACAHTQIKINPYKHKDNMEMYMSGLQQTMESGGGVAEDDCTGRDVSMTV